MRRELSTAAAKAPLELAVMGRVTRCGCAKRGQNPAEVHVWRGPHDLGPCPNPLRVEGETLLAYWHRNPVRRFLTILIASLRYRRRVSLINMEKTTWPQS